VLEQRHCHRKNNKSHASHLRPAVDIQFLVSNSSDHFQWVLCLRKFDGSALSLTELVHTELGSGEDIP
jgi:hypothetical protein